MSLCPSHSEHTYLCSSPYSCAFRAMAALNTLLLLFTGMSNSNSCPSANRSCLLLMLERNRSNSGELSCPAPPVDMRVGARHPWRLPAQPWPTAEWRGPTPRTHWGWTTSGESSHTGRSERRDSPSQKQTQQGQRSSWRKQGRERGGVLHRQEGRKKKQQLHPRGWVSPRCSRLLRRSHPTTAGEPCCMHP